MGAARFRILVAFLVLVAMGCSWTMVGHDGGHSFSSPFDGSITRENVGELRELWTGNGTRASVPVAGDGRVFTVQAAATGADLASYAAQGCGAAVCAPTWTQPAGGTPLLAGGHVTAESDYVSDCDQVAERPDLVDGCLGREVRENGIEGDEVAVNIRHQRRPPDRSHGSSRTHRETLSDASVCGRGRP